MKFSIKSSFSNYRRATLFCFLGVSLATFNSAGSEAGPTQSIAKLKSRSSSSASAATPPVVVTSTYLDGPGYNFGWDTAWACATDASGNVYVAGDTQEPGFPVTSNALQKTFGAGGQDGFVAKLDRNGNLLWSTFLGGSGWDGVFGLTVDGTGNVVITGVTQSSDFPVTANAIQSTLPAGSAAFVTIISSDGTTILYSTYLGGTQSDGVPVPTNPFHLLPPSDVEVLGTAIAIAADGTLYLAGETNAIDMPVTSGAAQSIIGGEADGFVAHIRTDRAGLAGLIYLTYLGGASNDFCSGIALDNTGNAFITGEAQSPNFPTTLGVYQRVHTPGTAAFVTKISSDGTSFIYSTLLSGTQGSSGGSGNNYSAGNAITIDNEGHAYIAGVTNDTDFPTTAGVVQTTLAGQDDGFVAEFAADGSSLIFSTYLGGSDYDGLFAIKLDDSGNIFVDGFSSSSDLTQVNAFQSFGGVTDCWVAELSSGATTLLLSSFFGGTNQEFAYGLDLRNNQLYLTGTTTSQDFPATRCAFDPTYNGASGDVFFAIVHLPATPVQLVSAASRKTHGSAGTFDINLPLTGNPGIECRSGGGDGNYTLVFNFANPLTSVGCATISSGNGIVSSGAIGSDPHEYIADLNGVADVQVITVSLSNISDSAGDFSSAVSASMGVLVGDTNGDGFVNSADISQTKSESGNAVTSANFREDVTADGFINSADISLVKSKSGSALP